MSIGTKVVEREEHEEDESAVDAVALCSPHGLDLLGRQPQPPAAPAPMLARSRDETQPERKAASKKGRKGSSEGKTGWRIYGQARSKQHRGSD